MIVRTWSGRTVASNAPEYVDHFTRDVLPQLEQIAGFAGATLLQDRSADRVEFLVLTQWESMEAVRRFAGDDASKAVVDPEAAAVLSDFDKTVRHYEVAAQTAR